MVTRRIRTDGFVDPCIPTLAATPPSGPDWVHEIKHDGYRLIVRRGGPCGSRGRGLNGRAAIRRSPTRPAGDAHSRSLWMGKCGLQ
jgi:hypothetical protein